MKPKLEGWEEIPVSYTGDVKFEYICFRKPKLAAFPTLEVGDHIEYEDGLHCFVTSKQDENGKFSGWRVKGDDCPMHSKSWKLEDNWACSKAVYIWRQGSIIWERK